jgi:ribosomal protein S17
MKKEATQNTTESKAKLLKGVVVSTKMKDTVKHCHIC